MRWSILEAAGAAILVGLILSTALGSIGPSDVRVEVSALSTPLFKRQLDDMAIRFGTAPAILAHAGAAEPQRRMAPTQQQAIFYMSEAASYCVASACLGSGCVSSGCIGSGCVGSACLDSECAGSACANCNRRETPGPTRTMADGRAYCPIDGEDAIEPVRLTGFEIAPTLTETEIRFAASGPDVQAYRVFRLGGDGHDLVLLAEGPARAGEHIQVVDAEPASGSRVSYTVEIVDRFGRVHRATIDQPPELVEFLRPSDASAGDKA